MSKLLILLFNPLCLILFEKEVEATILPLLKCFAVGLRFRSHEHIALRSECLDHRSDRLCGVEFPLKGDILFVNLRHFRVDLVVPAVDPVPEDCQLQHLLFAVDLIAVIPLFVMSQ